MRPGLQEALRELKSAAKVLALLPLLLGLLIPSGFMPEVTSDGQFTVVICTADGLQSVALDENGAIVPDEDGDDTEQVSGLCPFSALGQNIAAVERFSVQSSFAAERIVWPAGQRADCYPAAVPCVGARAPPLSI